MGAAPALPAKAVPQSCICRRHGGSVASPAQSPRSTAHRVLRVVPQLSARTRKPCFPYLRSRHSPWVIPHCALKVGPQLSARTRKPCFPYLRSRQSPWDVTSVS